MVVLSESIILFLKLLSLQFLKYKIDFINSGIFFFRQLITLGILEPLAGDVILDLVQQKIETEVQEITKENFGEHQITALEKVCFYHLFILKMYLMWFKYFINSFSGQILMFTSG